MPQTYQVGDSIRERRLWDPIGKRYVDPSTSTTPASPPTPAGVPTPQESPTLTNKPSKKPSIVQPDIVEHASIRAKLLKPALTSHYQCWFNPPGPVRDWIRDNRELDYNFNQELISLSCCDASLPGSSLMTNEITDDYTGVTERLAYRRSYDDRSDFTFYVDHGEKGENYNVLWFFENWISYIVNEDYSKGLEDANYTYRVNYPDDYQSPALYINKFERDFYGNYLEYRFLQAYPISISSMPISYESSQLLKCTVSFTYTRYLMRRLNHKITQRTLERSIDAGVNASARALRLAVLPKDPLNPAIPPNPPPSPQSPSPRPTPPTPLF